MFSGYRLWVISYVSFLFFIVTCSNVLGKGAPMRYNTHSPQLGVLSGDLEEKTEIMEVMMNREGGKAILLSYEGCSGADTDLGFVLLAKLLETLPEREDRPVAIICWNTAVRLLAEDSPLLGRFKRLEEKGVDIMVGESCIYELGLTGKIAAGKTATLNEILDVILNYEVVSL